VRKLIEPDKGSALSKGKMGRQIVGAVFWVAVGVFFLISGVNLRFGSFRRPGPGFLPLTMALLLVLFGLIDLMKGSREPSKPLGGIPWRRPIVVLSSVVLYCALLDFIGFLPSTFVLVGILFGLFITPRKNKWRSVIVYAAISALVAWLVFGILLRIPFPTPLSQIVG
jgi:hypothetical protein